MGRFDPLIDLCYEGVRDEVFPGAAFAVGDLYGCKTAWVGKQRYDLSPLIGPDTLWDIASLTKVVATTSLVMVLEDEGSFNLDTKVVELIPEFSGAGKEQVSLQNLLLHNSGLPSYPSDASTWEGPSEAESAILMTELEAKPGDRTEYSCVGFCVLKLALERLTRRSYEELVKSRVLQPTGMLDTMFSPAHDQRHRCAPTVLAESWRLEAANDRRYIQGFVQDPVAFKLGGVSGNAGLFAPLGDIARFADAVLAGLPPLRSSTIARWTRRQSTESTRALGWDTKSEEGSSAGGLFSASSFGHTGYTGTSIWIDPQSKLFAVLLTNRVHPSDDNARIQEFRPRFHDLAFKLLVEA